MYYEALVYCLLHRKATLGLDFHYCSRIGDNPTWKLLSIQPLLPMSIRFGVTIPQTDPQIQYPPQTYSTFIFRSMAKLRHPIAFRHVSSIYLFNDSKSILSELWVGSAPATGWYLPPCQKSIRPNLVRWFLKYYTFPRWIMYLIASVVRRKIAFRPTRLC